MGSRPRRGHMENLNTNPGSVATAEPEAPNSDAALRSLALAVSLHLRGSQEQALKELDRAEEHASASDLPEIHAARGHINSELGRFDAAALSFTRLVELLPNDIPTRYKLGLCLQHIGRYAEALENFRAAISLGDQDLKTKLAAGACLLQLNDGKAAVEAYDTALAQAPDSEDALFGKAVGLQLLWEFDEAIAIYERILAVNPRAEETLANLISLSLQRKDYESVRRWSDQLLAHRPDAVAGLVG